mmetsp:Transcript_22146/g.57766  ORF Transcript_22146/g.57766 Transcript_22146/m.57766 type:complete len:233 (-) Transcript_22146:296-994(-)
MALSIVPRDHCRQYLPIPRCILPIDIMLSPCFHVRELEDGQRVIDLRQYGLREAAPLHFHLRRIVHERPGVRPEYSEQPFAGVLAHDYLVVQRRARERKGRRRSHARVECDLRLQRRVQVAEVAEAFAVQMNGVLRWRLQIKGCIGTCMRRRWIEAETACAAREWIGWVGAAPRRPVAGEGVVCVGTEHFWCARAAEWLEDDAVLEGVVRERQLSYVSHVDGEREILPDDRG